MKKLALILLIMFALSLTACSAQGQTPAGVGTAGDAEDVTLLDAGIWPANEYTEGLPVPAGTISWAMLDRAHQNCGISITDISETEFSSYLALLKQAGFSPVEEVTEEIEGQNYVSIGTLLTDGERGLSISSVPNGFTIYIAFEK